MKFVNQVRQLVSDITARLRMFNYFHQHYDTRTARNLSRSRTKEMRGVK